jgi:hypothetical protein
MAVARFPGRFSLQDEYREAQLGDRRRSRRLVQVAEMMSKRPEESFPGAASNDAELEATYRFLSNEDITAEAVLAPHVRQTVRRAGEAASVVVAHDTTEFNFGKSPREDLGRVGQGKSFGFYGHFALAIAATGERDPLGVVAFAIHQRLGGKGRAGHRARQADPTNEFQRWHQVLEEAEQQLTHVNPVHVMDREADSYAFLADLVRDRRRFVIRMASASRRLADEPGCVGEVIGRAHVVAEREVPLSARGRSSMPSYAKYHPERQARTARVEISASTVTIKRPSSANANPARAVTLNVVRVFEPSPPEGQPAVEWRLWTTEPVATAADVLAVVDLYRCRWRIEEFFKALKTGCAIEQRQLESHDALVKTVALMAPIAWRLLRLRTLAHKQSELPATAVLTPRQLRCLRGALAHRRRPALPPNPTVRDAMLGVAGVGGHIKNNGDPGWIVLGRGLDDLLMIEVGYAIASSEDM